MTPQTMGNFVQFHKLGMGFNVSPYPLQKKRFLEKSSTAAFPIHSLVFSAGPAAQRQVQNGPSPDEMEAQRR